MLLRNVKLEKYALLYAFFFPFFCIHQKLLPFEIKIKNSALSEMALFLAKKNPTNQQLKDIIK